MRKDFCDIQKKIEIKELNNIDTTLDLMEFMENLYTDTKDLPLSKKEKRVEQAYIDILTSAGELTDSVIKNCKLLSSVYKSTYHSFKKSFLLFFDGVQDNISLHKYESVSLLLNKSACELSDLLMEYADGVAETTFPELTDKIFESEDYATFSSLDEFRISLMSKMNYLDCTNIILDRVLSGGNKSEYATIAPVLLWLTYSVNLINRWMFAWLENEKSTDN